MTTFKLTTAEIEMTTVETTAFAIFEGCAFLAVDFSMLQTTLLKKKLPTFPHDEALLRRCRIQS